MPPARAARQTNTPCPFYRGNVPPFPAIVVELTPRFALTADFARNGVGFHFSDWPQRSTGHACFVSPAMFYHDPLKRLVGRPEAAELLLQWNLRVSIGFSGNSPCYEYRSAFATYASTSGRCG